MSAGSIVYLVRHGEVAQAETRRFIGHLDVPLSERGERQCAAQARALSRVPFAAVFTSDLARSRRSGEIIAAPHGLAPTPVAALREMAMGRWDGLTAQEIEAREPDRFTQWMARVDEFPFPGGESVPELVARMEELQHALDTAGEPARFFVGTYLRTTRAVGSALVRGVF